MKSGDDPPKVIIVGDQDVGKTSIISALIEGKSAEGIAPTISSTMQRVDLKTSEGETVQVQLWDTAGEEQYRSLTKVFFRDSDAAIIVFDLSSDKAMNSVVWWYNTFKEVVGDEAFPIIAANKADLIDEDKVDSICGNIKEQLGIDVMAVSALNGTGIRELFAAIADEVKDDSVVTQRLQPSNEERDRCTC